MCIYVAIPLSLVIFLFPYNKSSSTTIPLTSVLCTSSPLLYTMSISVTRVWRKPIMLQRHHPLHLDCKGIKAYYSYYLLVAYTISWYRYKSVTGRRRGQGPRGHGTKIQRLNGNNTCPRQYCSGGDLVREERRLGSRGLVHCDRQDVAYRGKGYWEEGSIYYNPYNISPSTTVQYLTPHHHPLSLPVGYPTNSAQPAILLILHSQLSGQFSTCFGDSQNCMDESMFWIQFRLRRGNWVALYYLPSYLPILFPLSTLFTILCILKEPIPLSLIHSCWYIDNQSWDPTGHWNSPISPFEELFARPRGPTIAFFGIIALSGPDLLIPHHRGQQQFVEAGYKVEQYLAQQPAHIFA